MVLLAIWEKCLHENNCNYDSYRFSYKYAFILFLSFLDNQKQESSFQQVCSVVTRNISVFCLYRVALYFKAMPNSIDFYKGIFLHVIPVRMIVPCFKEHLQAAVSARFLFYESNHQKVLKKMLWKIWENSQENVRKSIYFLKF